VLLARRYDRDHVTFVHLQHVDAEQHQHRRLRQRPVDRGAGVLEAAQGAAGLGEAMLVVPRGGEGALGHGRERYTPLGSASMTDAWDWLAPIRERHLSAPLLRRFAIEPLDADAYWALHEARFRAHYPPEAFLDLRRVLDADARARADRVARSEAAGALWEHWVARDGDDAIAVFSGPRAPATGATRCFT
jgi:hypothetical protein